MSKPTIHDLLLELRISDDKLICDGEVVAILKPDANPVVRRRFEDFVLHFERARDDVDKDSEGSGS